MLTARFVDRSEEFFETLQRKLLASVAAAASELVEEYKGALSIPAPPHSKAGGIPHAYFGWKPGGYGPVNDDTLINNPGQTDFLYTYIDSRADDLFGTITAFVGFQPNHASGDNYLIGLDRGTIRDVDERPWIFPVFQRSVSILSNAAKEAFEATP